ncbi:MAG TPA: lipopolysaccharide heptosyltransferase II [Gemmataceae bacterium]|jgi:heptosyltransferase-2|nr:lipopolysaccharide heptosyltransferase II [Gemmataceae bacterium]
MRIALFLPNWIGDVVMATPAIRAVREHNPTARITAIALRYVADVLNGSTWIDDRVVLDPRRRIWSAAAELRARVFDQAILFPNSFRSALIAWLGSCQQRVGYAREGRSLLLTHRLYAAKDARGRFIPAPVLLAYNRLAEAAGCPVSSNRMQLFVSAEEQALAEEVWQLTGLNQFEEVVCLNPGAAFGAAKLWPAQYFVQLARKLVDRRGSGVLVLCGPTERDLSRKIAHAANRPQVHSLADFPVSLGLTKGCLQRANFLVSTDSGPRHIGVALGKPVISLFGPTHIAWTDTFAANDIHLQKSVPCGPCQLRTCPLDHRCMRELTPSEVFAAVTAACGFAGTTRRSAWQLQ